MNDVMFGLDIEQLAADLDRHYLYGIEVLLSGFKTMERTSGDCD
jgi:hypothetical protein